MLLDVDVSGHFSAAKSSRFSGHRSSFAGRSSVFLLRCSMHHFFSVTDRSTCVFLGELGAYFRALMAQQK